MSEYTVLYYPSFHPDPAWLRKVLLLADHVARIVPTEVALGDPAPISELLRVLPDALVNLAPTADDITLDDLSLSRVGKAFRLLSRNPIIPQDRTELTIHKGGGISVAGHMFLHRSKVAPEVGRLLAYHKLAQKDVNAMIRDAPGSADYIVVDERASHLVLSCIADRMARRHGLDALTERPLDYSVNVLGNLGIVDWTDNPEGALLSSIAAISIPSDVTTVDVQRYKEVRDSYSEIRSAFQVLIAELSSLNRLGRITDSAVLRTKIAAIAADFDRECKAWEKTRWARTFKSWTPLCVGGVLSVAAALVSPLAAAGIVTGTFAIQVFEKSLAQSNIPNPRERVYQMLVGMRRDILKRSPLKKLLVA